MAQRGLAGPQPFLKALRSIISFKVHTQYKHNTVYISSEAKFDTAGSSLAMEGFPYISLIANKL